MNKTIIISGLTLLALGSAFYAMRSDIKVPSSIDEKIKPDESSDVGSAPSPTKSNTLPTNQPSISALKNCGSMPTLKFSGTLDFKKHFDSNAQEEWTCMTEALKSCTPATASIGPNTYSILKRENNICYVSGRAFDLNTQDTVGKIVTCGFSNNLISYAYEVVGLELPGVEYAKGFQLMSLITGGGGALELPNGSKETVICN